MERLTETLNLLVEIPDAQGMSRKDKVSHHVAAVTLLTDVVGLLVDHLRDLHYDTRGIVITLVIFLLKWLQENHPDVQADLLVTGYQRGGKDNADLN